MPDQLVFGPIGTGGASVAARGCGAIMTFELAICSEMVFSDLDIVERARRISELGFAVEIWSFHDKNLDALAVDRRPLLIDDRVPARRSLRPGGRPRGGAYRAGGHQSR